MSGSNNSDDSISGEELTRYTTEDGRVYTDGENLYLPSVSTVLDERETPVALKKWKEYTSNWREILRYKSNRGTMVHYKLLNEFAPEDMYGTDEENSEDELKLDGDWERFRDDLTFAEEAWEQIKRERGIIPENVIDVECFVTNLGVGYAGQFDLLYVDKEGDLVLSDLKTSKGVYDKHQLQLTAYSHALNVEIDKLEVIRIHPDSETYEISHDSDWNESREDLWAEFVELRHSMGDVESKLRRLEEEGIQD